MIHALLTQYGGRFIIFLVIVFSSGTFMSEIALRFSDADAGVELSAEQFASADFKEPFIYERVQGRLVVMSLAGPEHRKVSRPFRRELGLYWGTHKELVEEVDAEGWVSTSPVDDRIPDICVYLFYLKIRASWVPRAERHLGATESLMIGTGANSQWVFHSRS
jgi:hypothetical protein